MKLSDGVEQLKGVGPKTAKLFEKVKVHSIEDLLHFYPRNYLTYDSPVDIEDAVVGERVAIRATIQTYVDVKKIRNFTLATCQVRDGTGTVKLTWFHSAFLKKMFHIGQTYVFVGTLSRNHSQLVMEHPEYYTETKYCELLSSLQPVYPLTEGLSNKMVAKAVSGAFALLDDMKERIPCEIVSKYGLLDIKEAIRGVHFPKDFDSLIQCRKRLVFDEFFLFLLSMQALRESTVRMENSYIIKDYSCVDAFVEQLPFELTKGQISTLKEIKEDMSGQTVMNRLVQGDVGSGKTAVAEMAMLAVVKNGYQAAFMAPTEVLAKQHYESITKDFEHFDLKVALLVGSTKISEKRKIYEALLSGQIDIVIGTHALIQDKVAFKNLALVITDEQHRFGVRQRQILADKSDNPHVLVMSATPIPRTLAIIMYGDLDISVMRDMPAMRKPIKNCVVGQSYRKTAYNFMKTQIEQGHQIYIICPMVESSETVDAENVVEYRDELKEIFPADVAIEYLHGKMPADEKNRIMESFAANKIQILVSTTVIEVGINNPNATVMMIENAEKFGLAQLHQLRGRVGRGQDQSYCIFMCGTEQKQARERLEILNQSNDGFFIANEDLKLRGPGDFFGVRQSGDMLFHLGDIYSDADVLKLANDAVSYARQNKIDVTALTQASQTMTL